MHSLLRKICFSTAFPTVPIALTIMASQGSRIKVLCLLLAVKQALHSWTLPFLQPELPTRLPHLLITIPEPPPNRKIDVSLELLSTRPLSHFCSWSFFLFLMPPTNSFPALYESSRQMLLSSRMFSCQRAITTFTVSVIGISSPFQLPEGDRVSRAGFSEHP